jgi:diguanylate cyclase (GGDEF)-like protein
LAAFACLHIGFVVFLKQVAPTRRHALLILCSGVLMLVGYSQHMLVLRLWVYCGAAAWLLGSAAVTAFRGLRDEFSVTNALIVTAPLTIACILQALRALVGSAGADATDALRPTVFNAGLLWSGFVVVLSLNFAIAGFVGARQVARIHALTLIDPLTGAVNRRALESLLDKELISQRRHSLPLSVICFDLDHFKLINDEFGHAAGDLVLRQVSALAQQCCRKSDTLARIGGEEFCMVLQYTDVEGACLMAERLRSALVDTRMRWAGVDLQVTASFGVASMGPNQAHGWRDLIHRADRAMYGAKQAGRNRVATAAPVHGDELPV